MGTLRKAASTHGMCEAKATRADVVASGSVLDAKACEVQDKAVMGGFAREQLDRAASIWKRSVSAPPRPERVVVKKREQEAEQK